MALDATAIAERCQSLRSPSSLTFDQERRFWSETATTEGAATSLAATLLLFVAAVETGEDRNASLPDLLKKANLALPTTRAATSAEQTTLRDALLKTLNFLALFRPYNVSNTLLRAATTKLALLKAVGEHQIVLDSVCVCGVCFAARAVVCVHSHQSRCMRLDAGAYTHAVVVCFLFSFLFPLFTSRFARRTRAQHQLVTQFSSSTESSIITNVHILCSAMDMPVEQIMQNVLPVKYCTFLVNSFFVCALL